MATYEHLLIHTEDGITTLTLNRPAKRNALNQALLDELSDAVAMTHHANRDARVVIVTGAGDKAFAAGADIAEMTEMTTLEAKLFSDSGHRLCTLIEESPCPFIAAVNGRALGGGCELALACDFIYASDRAELGQPEVGLGIIPGFGGTQRLARRVGIGRARELVYTAESLSAERARNIGLVNDVFPSTDLPRRTLEVARVIASRSPVAIAAAKRVILRGCESNLVAGNELEAQAFAALFGTDDQREGMQAFLEKRTPQFSGR